MGNDLCITLGGGDRPHIGCVAIADPRESLKGDGSLSATVSTFNFTGHKDDEVANLIACSVARRLNKRVVVVCGLHFDNVSDSLFDDVREQTRKLIDAICEADL